ncbi:hypothetical protein AVEN_101845-1 [Araneus ventricosus]|uniref:Uncharacterized protein n=1 Tax=Araneus ventricosus TaxID=182803 RepID=A0A4Y2REQ7_ARAVE|nr:hypothetical protein AVEN_101845-1 [Araneus ventricosus]
MQAETSFSPPGGSSERAALYRAALNQCAMRRLMETIIISVLLISAHLYWFLFTVRRCQSMICQQVAIGRSVNIKNYTYDGVWHRKMVQSSVSHRWLSPA